MAAVSLATVVSDASVTDCRAAYGHGTQHGGEFYFDTSGEFSVNVDATAEWTPTCVLQASLRLWKGGVQWPTWIHSACEACPARNGDLDHPQTRAVRRLMT